MKLTKRLRAVVNLVLPTDSMVDVGCDHGYVSLAMIQEHLCKKVIATDINEGPLARARENISEYGLTDYIETRQSNGLEHIGVGEVSGMVCAGMGGRLMLQILRQGCEQVKRMEEVILQPQSEIALFRETLYAEGFKVLREDMVEEDDIFYPMMSVRYEPPLNNGGEVEEELRNYYGESLLLTQNAVLHKYLIKERDTYQQILLKLGDTDTYERKSMRREEIMMILNRNERAQQYF